MRYVFCFLCPPLAVASTGKVVSTLVNCLLTLCLVVPGIIHAFGVVSDWKQDKRVEQLARMTRNNREPSRR